MKKLPLAILVLALSSFTLFLNAQTLNSGKSQSLNSRKAIVSKSASVSVNADSSMDWVGMMRNPSVNVHDVQKAFYAWYNKKHPNGDKDRDKETLNKGKADNDDESYELFKRWEWFTLPRSDANGNRPDFNKIGTEYHDYLNSAAGRSSRTQRLTGNRLTPNNSWAADWTYIGNTAVPSNSPDGSGYGGNGRVNRIRVMPGSTTTFFACAAAGGLWKTTDGGTTWSTNTDQLGDLTTSDIAINPSKTNIMYLATGDGDGIQSIYPDPATIGVLKSYDGGATWSATTLSYTLSNAGANYYSVNELLIDPSDTSVIIAATTMGIYRSTNSGATWTLATGTGSGNATWFHNIAFHPGNSKIVYATTSNIIFGVGGGFYRSLDNGASWTNITSGLPSNTTVEGMALAVSAADTADVFVLATSPANAFDFYGLYVSTNHGTSFTTLASKAGGAPNILGRAASGNDYGTGQGWYDLTLNVSQTNIDTILVGGINVWETYNEGTSWSLSGYWFTGGNTYVHADNHDIEFMPGSSRTFLVGCDGGVFKTSNEGSTWTNLSHNLEIAQQYCVGAAATVSGTVITGWQDNGTNTSTSPWGQVSGGDGTDCFIDYTNSAIMYAETPGAPMFMRSTNSGTSWSNIDGTISESGEWVTPWLEDPKTNTTLYCGILNIWKSTNSGGAWSSISSWGATNYFVSALAVDSANVNYIYAGANDNSTGADVVEMTSNGGTSWSNITGSLPYPIMGITVNSKSPSHVWVTVGGYSSGKHVYYSTNSGTSWTNITGNLPNLPVNCAIYESGTANGVFVGTDQGVYYNDTTMGTTWQFYNTNLPLVMVANLTIWNPIKPTAYFKASPLAVCQGSSVQFTDTTHNSPARQLIGATYGRGTWETPIDSAPRLTYSWTFTGGTPGTSSLQNPSIMYTSSGTYTVSEIVTNSAGSSTVTKTNYITVYTPPSVSITLNNNVSCLGGSNGSAKANASSGTSPYTYLWSNTGTSSNQTALSAGNYTVTVTDKHGCTATASVAITQPATGVSVTANATAEVLCNGGSTGSASSSPVGGSSPYTYLWSGGGTNQTKSSLSAGTYTITVTDHGGCTATASVSITQPTALGVTIASHTNVSCNGGSTGSATANVATGGTSPYTYSWSGGGGTNLTASSLAAGSYTITAKDNNGCTATASVSITQPAVLAGNASVTANVSCNGGNNGSASSAPTGGTSPYTYSWSGGGSNSTKTSLASGGYTVTVTDINGCIATSSVSITQPATAVSVIATETSNTNCSADNGSVSSTPSGGTSPYSYLWTGGSTNSTESNLSAGTYTITVTDNHGCTSSASATVTQVGASITESIASHTDVNCNGGNTGNATANPASGGASPYTYNWTPSGGTNLAASNLSAGVYTITVTDNNGCNGSASVNITQPATVLGETIASHVNVNCNGGNTGSATANAATGGTSPYTYLWSGGGGTNLAASNLTAGSYTITATDNHGCTATASVSITQPATALGVTIASHTNENCNGGSNASATASAATGGTSPYTYLWSGGGGTNLTASSLTAGSYTITATDNHGCTATASVSITQPATVLGETIASHVNVSCKGGNDGSATANAATGGTSPYTYLWSGGGGTNLTASSLTAGSYTITATDNHGCTATASVSITQPATVLGETIASHINVNCKGGNDGSATANAATGGTSPYTYLWSGGGGSNLTASNLTAGSYTITATDNHGCSATASVSITQPATALGVTIASHTNENCNGGSNASATASAATGGTSPYTYLWSGGGGTNLTASSLTAGSYTITATDNHGCTATASVSITQPAITISITIASQTDVNCNGGNTGSATANAATGGTSPYTYLWSGGGGSNLTASSLTAGSYTITATDNHGCTATASVSITQPATALGITIASHTNVACHGGTGSATANAATGGTSPYTYLWSGGGGTNLTAPSLTAGSYTITATDNHGCSATASVSITQPATVLGVAIASHTNENCNGGSNASATASAATGGTSPYTYLWSGGGGTNLTASSLTAGSYTITATDNHGCTATASVSITQPAITISITIASQTNVACNGGNTGSATANAATGGTSPYTYLWSGGGGTNLTASNLAAGGYTITATDNHGCSATASVSITQPNSLLANASVTADVSCRGGNNGSALSSPTGGTGAYTYSWSGGGTNATKTGLTAGNYTVTVTDNNTCTTTASISITQPITALGVTASATANVSCNGGSNGIVSSNPTGGTGAYTYSWSGGGTNATKTGLTAGSYTITITDNNGCVATASVSVTQPITALGVTASATANVSCLGGNNGSVSSGPTGGTSPYTYSWNGGGTNATKTGLTAGSYTITITDNNGCIATASVSVSQPATSVGVTASATANVSCLGGNNGSALSSPTGGTSPYSYSWNGGGTNATKTGLTAGTYTVTVTDNNGCTSTASVSISQPATSVGVTASATANVSCLGGNNGSVSSSPTGGTSPYSYFWNGGGTNATKTGLTAGTYTVTVTDNNGCTSTASVSLTQPATAVSISMSAHTNILCNGSATGSATASAATGGTGTYIYSWAPSGGTNLTVTNLTAGTYTITATDNNGCKSTASAMITQPAAMVIKTDSVDVNSTTGACNGEASVTVMSGGKAPYTYSWSPGGATTDTIKNKCTGDYCCTITDNNGCTENTCVVITNSTGVANVGDASDINIYPDPNLGTFTVAGVVKGQVIEVYNDLGQQLNSVKADKSIMYFDISNRANGVYMVRIIDKDGNTVAQRKIIKTQ